MLRNGVRRGNVGDIIVGGICFVAGVWCGVFTLALVSINKNTAWVKPTEEKQEDGHDG